MKKIALLIMILPVLKLGAQEKDPQIRSISSQFQRIEIVRMRSGTDMLDGLKSFVSEKKVRNGVILAGIGSVSQYHYHVVSDANLPPAEEFPKASVAMDLVSVQGYILDGRVHAHISLSDENSMVGGHLESGTKALTFFIITVGVLPDDLDMGDLDNYRL